MSRVLVSDGCWNWTGPVDIKKGGYGIIHDRESGQNRSHRVMWILCYGDIPKNMWVLHTCDNPRCVKPSHLYLGTSVENSRDRVIRGRGAYGTKNGGGVKLDDVKIIQIKEMFNTGKITKAHLARIFGVSETTIYRIVRGKSWKHVSSNNKTVGL